MRTALQIGIVFETATPFDTPRLMAELLTWVSDERDQSTCYTPCSSSASSWSCFSKSTRSRMATGVLSRVLTTLLLLQAGYAYVPYSSLESVIEAQQGRLLPRVAADAGHDPLRCTPNWQPWLLFFLRSLAEQVRRLEKKVEREKIVLAALPELSLQIVEFAREHGRVTIGRSDQVDRLSSRNTLKQHFRDLTERNHLEQHGSGRGVWYGLK
jgi:hypothetical protein